MLKVNFPKSYGYTPGYKSKITHQPRGFLLQNRGARDTVKLSRPRGSEASSWAGAWSKKGVVNSNIIG